MKKIAFAFAGFALLFSLSQASHADKMLSGDEIKALVTNKTISVIYSSSNQWRQYFAADGSSIRDNGETSTWNIDGDNHCNSASAKFPCAPIRDNGDGTYSRLKSDGSPIVTWTKFVEGKDF